MNSAQPFLGGLLFSRQQISQQLERIFTDRMFAESAILKRFLDFIVNQTLEGNSNCVKEYTIAVHVLGKPVQFKPQENGIVRIHAGRLRRALYHYYNNQGSDDPIFISIPKGKYIPTFSEKKLVSDSAISLTGIDQESHDVESHSLETTRIAILPLYSEEQYAFNKKVFEGMWTRLANAILQQDCVELIARQATESAWKRTQDFCEIAASLEAAYLITLELQSHQNQMRIHLQMMKTSNWQLVWSESFERPGSTENLFVLQDVISELIANSVLKNIQLRNGKQISTRVLEAV